MFKSTLILSDVSALDREKFFAIHSGSTNDSQISSFLSEYDVTLGRQFWGALPYARNQTGQVGVYPNTTPSTDQSVRPTTRMVQTGHPRDALRWNTDVQEAADWVTTYYTTVVDTVPEFYEPINEPFVHAGDFEFSDAPSTEAMRLKMAQLYAAIGEAVDQTPALADMNVIGYSSAWPSVELWDFGHWDSRMKMFMDVAGDHMDGFATHLYDGVNVTGQNNRRSGSNSEAILDLIETYSYTKWGFVKPHAITEYGGIEQGYGEAYSDLRSAQSLRSINHLLFNLLEREDDMMVSIPFITDKSTWYLNAANNYEPYGPALWRPTGPNGTGPFEYTWRINFFELWKDVKGDRGLIETSDPDVQAQLFVDGSTAYVAINNLADETETVGLEFLSGLSGFQNVEIREMEVPINGTPLYTETMETTAPESISLETGGTAVLVYHFDAPIEFTDTIRSKKYYTSQHLESISAGQAINFNFNGVQTSSEGDALLRMGIGRKHNRSKAPTVTVNGTNVDVPNDWAGYDQTNRDDFFGVIEIPVPVELLNTDNTVTVTFPDSGGRVSSMILNVEAIDAPQLPTEVTSLTRDGQPADDMHLLDRPDQLQVISVQFNHAVDVELNDLKLMHDSSGGTVVNLASANFSYDPLSFTATWDLAGAAEFLPWGYYTASIPAANVTSAASGQEMLATFSRQLYKAIPGDANLDGSVSVLGDGFALVGNLGTTENAPWTKGDFNGDGMVSVLGDGFVLVGNLGESATPASAQFISTSPISDQTFEDPDDSLQRDIAFASDYAWTESEEKKKWLVNDHLSGPDARLPADEFDTTLLLS
jgi:hypothetical protein